MVFKNNKKNNYIIIGLPLVIAILLGIFNFVYNSINLVSETNQNNFAYTIKIRETVEEIDKIVERSEVNVKTLADTIKIVYDEKKLYDKKYNEDFISKINPLTKAALINSPGVDGSWFQLRTDLPFSSVMYTWYERQNGRYINLKTEIDKTDLKNREITPKTDPYYFEAIRNKKTTWSGIYVDSDTNDEMLSIMEPIFKNNTLIGVAGIDISIVNLKLALANMQKQFEGSDIFLLSKDGKIVLSRLAYSNLESTNNQIFRTLFDLEKNNQDKMVEYYDEGVRKTAILIALSNYYHIVISFPNNIILKGFDKLFTTIYLIFFLMAGLTVTTLLNLNKINKTNKELESKTKQLETIFKSTPNIISIKDINGKYKYCNQKFSNYLNIKNENMLGKQAKDLFSKDLADQIDQMDAIVKKTKKMVAYETCQLVNNVELYLRKFVIPLLNSQDEITNILIIAVDITQSMEEKNILKIAKETAEKNTEIKSNFLANMSHEIRTPLNGVLGFIQLLKDTNLTKEQEEFVIDAQKSSEILLYIINDILDFSKIEANKLQLENMSFNLHTLVEEITLFSTADAENKGLDINSLIASDVPQYVFGDPGRVRQILNNLVNNAIKFTQCGEIVIYVKQLFEDEQNTVLGFEVKDTGIGISEENIKLIFDEFSQADPSTTRKYGGTGLGLAISQRLVEKMGGDVDVQSKINEGSTFSFTLPFKKDETLNLKANDSIKALNGTKILLIDDNPTDIKIIRHYLSEANCVILEAKTCDKVIEILNQKKEGISAILVDYKMQINCADGINDLCASKDILGDIPIILYTSLAKRNDSKWVNEKGFKGFLTKPINKSELIRMLVDVINKEQKEDALDSQIAETPTIKGTEILGASKILIVEDNEINCKLMNKIFSKNSLNCDFAHNGLEAIEAFNTKKYDLILMDCQMPILDGYKATIAIRNLESENEHIPIIAMTANAMLKDREKCLEVGMDDYLSKPIDIDSLITILNKYTQHLPIKTIGELKGTPKNTKVYK